MALDLRVIPPKHSPYWGMVQFVAWKLGSNGCSGVPDFFRDACLEHDIHWRTGQTIDGEALTLAESNQRFRWVIQSRSIFGVWSPMSWWRWVGVLIAGMFVHHFWRNP